MKVFLFDEFSDELLKTSILLTSAPPKVFQVACKIVKQNLSFRNFSDRFSFNSFNKYRA